MRHISAVLAVALLVEVVCVPCLAQRAPSIAPGTRVRISAPSVSDNRVVGTIVAVSTDTLMVRESWRQATPWAVSLASVTQLEQSGGWKRNYAEGTVIGLASGVGVGVLIGFASGDDKAGFPALSARDKAVMEGVLFGGVGLILGTMVGGNIESEIWKPVPLDRVRIGVNRRSDGALALSASFVF